MSAHSQQETLPYKRRRVTLACRVCRHRKTRCNGGRPRCTSCIELGLACSYEQPEGLNGGGNDSQPSWEARLAAIENTIHSLVEAVTQNGVTTLSTPKNATNSRTNNYTTHIPTGTQDQSDLFVDDEAIDSPEEEEMEEDVTDGMASVACETAQTRRFFGPSSIIAFLQSASSASTKLLSSAEPYVRSPIGLQNGSLAPSKTSPVANHTNRGRRQSQAPDIYAFPPLDQADRLLDSFFSNTGMLFPYIHEPDVRTHFNHIKSHGPRKTAKSFLCLLNALFAMTVHVENPGKAGQVTEHSNLDPETFFNQALALLARSPRCSVARVQSLLIMCQYRQGAQNAEELCALHAEAVGISRELGLHTQVILPHVAPVQQQIRRRTWLTCIMLDKSDLLRNSIVAEIYADIDRRVLSMTFGQPQLIASESALWSITEEVDLFENTNQNPSGAEQPRPPSDLTTGYFATALYVLLGEILSVMYADNTDTKSAFDLSELIRLNISLERQLILWRNNLPPNLSMKPWMESAEQQGQGEHFGTVSSTILYLRYLNISILKDRPILLWFLRGVHTPMTDASPTASVDLHFTDMARVILFQIENKAKEAISISWSMSNRLQALGAWWFSTYYILNSCFVLFSCLLVHVHTARVANGVGLDVGKILAIEDALQKGVEAKSRILKTYRKPDRTQGVLDQLLKIARALTAEIRSCDKTRTDNTTIESSHSTSTGLGLANSQMSLGTHDGSLQEDSRDTTYSHSWPILNDNTSQQSIRRVENGNLQSLPWYNWGSGWLDIDLGFEDIVAF